jgi:hypothetical protein
MITTKHFEGREVPCDSEYAPASSLIEGHIYFTVSFVDRELLVPSMVPLVFIGRDLDEGDSGMLYFQDAASHVAGVRFGSADQDEAEFHCVHVDTPFVYEYERALDRLLWCSMERA